VQTRDEVSFPRQLRLTRADEFRQVFQNNCRQGDTSITILVGKKLGRSPRLGFAIAKKQIPKAVQRNRLKRIFRESFRKNQQRLPIRDMVVLVRRPILNLDRTQLNITLENHWNGVIKQCEKF